MATGSATRATKALDLHWFSEPTRNLIFAPRVLEFLHLIFERRALATQTLAFWRGSAQDGHQDSAYVNYSLPMQFAASWIALEDVKEGAGELFYHVGSHRMAEHLYLGKYKGVEDAARVESGSNRLNEEIKAHIERIAVQADGMGLKTKQLRARRGDVLFWSADLAHGGRPVSLIQTRKSVVTHYCPADVVPSYFENRPGAALMCHNGVASYSTSHYRAQGNRASGTVVDRL
jgi:phytanoyl-CoA hydroxylase